MAVGYTFEIDSSVGRYWLAHGAGFDVVGERGNKVGVVEDVVLDPATQDVSLVLVRRHGRRTAKVPPRALSAVLPASRCFVIGEAAERPKRTAQIRPVLAQAAAAVVAWAQRTWPVVERAVVTAARAAAQALAVAANGAAAGASRAWREAQQRRRT